jgi:hypothetical protein
VATEPASIHPTQQFRTPAGEPVEIDLEMVPLIRSLWALDFTTLGCCQDNGEYARARREMFPRGEPTGHSGFIDYHLGWAWLTMPIADTARLTEFFSQPRSATLSPCAGSAAPGGSTSRSSMT